MFDVFTNKTAIERLAKNDRTLAQKIYDKFKDILKVIKSKLKLFDTMNNNPEIRALMNDAESLEQIVNKFHDALDVAKNNFNVRESGKDAGNGQKNNADETANKFFYSMKDSFDKQVDDAINNKLNNRNALYVSDTPDILLKIGMNQLPMLYTQAHLRDAMKPKNPNNTHFHGLTEEQVKWMPEIINNPAIVLDSLTEKDCVVIVSDKLDNDNAPIILVVKPNGRGVYKLKQQDSNFIKSYYGKDNGFSRFIYNAYTQNKILFISKIKSQSLYQQIGLPLPNGLKKLGFDNIIQQSNNIVNNNLMQNSQKNAPKKITSMNSSAKSLDEMKDERSTLQDEYREFKGQIDNLKASAEYMAFEDEIRKVRKNGSLFGGFEAVKEIRRQRDEWADEAGLTELQKRYHDISEQIHDYDLAIYKIEKEQKIKATEETAKKLKIPALSR